MKKTQPNLQFSTPFNDYFKLFDKYDKKVKYTEEYGSFLIKNINTFTTGLCIR